MASFGKARRALDTQAGVPRAALPPRVRTVRALRGSTVFVVLFVAFSFIADPQWGRASLAVAAAVLTSVGVLAWIDPGGPVGELRRTRPSERLARDMGELRLGKLRRDLVQSTTSADAFGAELLPLLQRLADDRLQAGHGITMASRPDAARTLLGEELWDRLTTRPPRAPDAEELRRLVTALHRVGPA